MLAKVSLIKQDKYLRHCEPNFTVKLMYAVNYNTCLKDSVLLHLK